MSDNDTSPPVIDLDLAACFAAADPAVVLELVVLEFVRRLRAAGSLVAALQDEVDRERAHRNRQDAGGQQAPHHGDFAGAGPSTLGRLDWWARALREALGG